MRPRTLGLALLFTFTAATSGWAQSAPTAPTPRLIVSERAVAAGLASAAAAQPLRSDDSVMNGAVIGAVVGGIALGAFGAYVCHMTGEVGDPSCWPAILRIGAVGAGLGAAAGAGIDALRSRSGPVVMFRVRTDGRRVKLLR